MGDRDAIGAMVACWEGPIMILYKVICLGLFVCAVCLNMACGLPHNPYDPEDPYYKKPSMTFEGLPADGGEIDSGRVVFVAKGNTPKNVFRWRIENSCSNDTLWRAWSSDGNGKDTILLSQLCSLNTIHIQTAYSSENADIADSTSSFRKLNLTVTYDGNSNTGGTVPIDTTHYKRGQEVTVLGNTGNLTKPHSAFDSWNTKENGSGTKYQTGATVAMGFNSILLFAQWGPKKDTVTFDDQGATTPANPITRIVTYPESTIGALPSNPIKTDYYFLGWFTSQDDSGILFTANTVVSASIIVYAKWKDINMVVKGMVRIPAKDKTFYMGDTVYSNDEKPVHQVKFSADYWMDATEVTQGNYDNLMKVTYGNYTKPSWKSSFGIGNNYPVYSVSWYDAVLYCNARTKAVGYSDTVYSYTGIWGIPGNGCSELSRLGIDLSKRGFRLPTEAQWEYACRGGTKTSFYWGKNYDPYPSSLADSNQLDSFAIWTRNSYQEESGSTDYGVHPVATKKSSAFRLYDMSGNVWEWCNDWYGGYNNDSRTDPTGPEGGSRRALRGGGWSSGAMALRSASRGGSTPDCVGSSIGFRVCLPAR
jgi:sulfatase modifying factor 1